MYNSLQQTPKCKKGRINHSFLHIHIENEKESEGCIYGCLGNLVYNSWYFIYRRNVVDYILHALAWNWAVVGGLIALFAPDALLLQVTVGAIVSLTLTFFTKEFQKLSRSKRFY